MAAFLAMAGVKALGGLIGGITARSRRKQAESRMNMLNQELNRLEASRQKIIDPTAGVSDLSSLINNPFANLQVATGAAEMQAQQADLSLAQTLDTLRATGSGAGGATALAQAALRSKQGVAASIESQEAQNARLRAQGEQRAQMMQLQEGGRVQSLKVKGQEFMFNAREDREIAKLNRTAGLLDQARGREQALRAKQDSAFGQAVGALGGAVAYGLGGDDFREALNASVTGGTSET